MSIKARISSVVLIIAFLTGFWYQRSLLNREQEENGVLKADREQQSLPVADEPPTDDATGAARHELARLRNEVRQLRAERRDLDVMREGNNRLREQVSHLNQTRPAPGEELGFVMNSNWGNAGFSSPEATIQTFFWATRQMDYDALISCLTPDTAQAMRFIDKRTQAPRPEAMESLLMLGRVSGYRVTQLRSESDDSVKGKVQCAVNGAEITFGLQLLDGAWKINLH